MIIVTLLLAKTFFLQINSLIDFDKAIPSPIKHVLRML
jgi:hypothetical protein